jgi:hypothetical protein
MTSVVDLWRAIDPEARLLAGSPAGLAHAVRAVIRTRALAPHLPDPAGGALLVVDGGLLGRGPLANLFPALGEGRIEPVAVMIAGSGPIPDGGDERRPLIASQRSVAQLFASASAYLADEASALAAFSTELRLACAEAALGDPQLATPAGLVAARIDRGVAISVDGELRALHPRSAGRALAARFAALHARLLAEGGTRRDGGRGDVARRTRDGLWLVERRIRPGASAWLFDDLPLAAVDEVAADALTATARALLRRPQPGSEQPATDEPRRATRNATATEAADPLQATLLAVARANGRVAPAARALGVHRNTVLYRLRRARAERGVDPRRPQDALRLLAEGDAEPY